MQVASKKVYWKKQQSVPNTCHISPLKKFFQNRCIFQISLMYIKLAIPKILFILVLCNFNFNFKTTWPLPIWKFLTTHPSPPPTHHSAKTFLKLLTPPPPPHPIWRGGGACHEFHWLKLITLILSLLEWFIWEKTINFLIFQKTRKRIMKS